MTDIRRGLFFAILPLFVVQPTTARGDTVADEVMSDSGLGKASIASARATIQEANSAWLPAMRRGDPEALAEPYADDALFVTTSGEAIRGRRAIKEFYKTRLASIAHVINGNLVAESSTVSGTLIYEWGHASVTTQRKDGTIGTSAGPYLTVWQRSSSGQWRIIRNLVF